MKEFNVRLYQARQWCWSLLTKVWLFKNYATIEQMVSGVVQHMETHLVVLKCIYTSCGLWGLVIKIILELSIVMWGMDNSIKQIVISKWSGNVSSDIIYIRNISGPSTVPWGTPDKTSGLLEEVWPSITICWMPYCDSYSNHWWSSYLVECLRNWVRVATSWIKVTIIAQ